MRARLEDLRWNEETSFLVRSFDLPRFDVPWHFHPELELTLILEGEGDRCIGDRLERFEGGDLVLLGPNLPHYWRSSMSQAAPEGRARAVVVHLREDSLGAGFLDLPEAREWKHLFAVASRGLAFGQEVAAVLAPQLVALASLEQAGGHRLISLLQILDVLVKALPKAQVMAGNLLPPSRDELATGRMRRVYDHLYEHLTEPVSLAQVALVAGMSEAAFSRYCHRVTGRTFTRLVNDLRVARACQALIETGETVSEVAFQAGFQSLSNFNRVFVELKKMTPSDYRQRHARRLGLPRA